MKALQYLLSLALLACASVASSQNLIKNGDFNTVYNKGTTTAAPTADSYRIYNSGGVNDNVGATPMTLADWSNTSRVALVYTPDSAGSRNSAVATGTNWFLFSKSTWYDNGLTSTSPAGGNFFATDSNYDTGALTQSVSGLTVGQQYTFSFYWAAAQLGTGNSESALTSGWKVGLAGSGGTDLNQSFLSAAYAPGGFVPWTKATISFTATSTNELLTMTPIGSGGPPMSLLDGVSLVAVVPETSSWMMLALGGAIVLRLGQRRRKA